MRTVASIDPLFCSEDRIPSMLVDLAGRLQNEANEFDKELPRSSHIRKQLRDMVRMMNCYYSNLIEGNNTRPAEIEAAMADAGKDTKRPYLLDEAVAHAMLQEKIDDMFLRGEDIDPVSIKFITFLHREFYRNAVDERLFSSRSDGSSQKIRPGFFRENASEDVQVGLHTPPASEDVNSFMAYYSKQYHHLMKKGPISALIAVGAAHHRFNYIHPFLDGNGRVSRLISHAMFRKLNVGVDGLWSVSRGLARGLKGMNRSVEYKNHMQRADIPRQGSLDGRGTLSLKELEGFCAWFLNVAIDQIQFMRSQFNGKKLQERYEVLIKDLYTGKEAEYSLKIIKTLFMTDEIIKGDLPTLLNCTAKTARNRLDPLLKEGFVVEDPDNIRAPYQLGLPKEYHKHFFPKLIASE